MGLRLLLVLAGFALGIPAASFAHKLNPCLRVLEYADGELGASSVNWYNACRLAPEQYRMAVHEHMTVMSVDQYRRHRRWDPRKRGTQKFDLSASEAAWTEGESTISHRTHNIVYGTWWNDDPLMLLWGQGKDITMGLGKLYKAIEGEGSEGTELAGGTADCAVPVSEHLAHESHFGQLQHLHYMTNLEKVDTDQGRMQRLADTQRKALQWLAFAYRVATGKIKPQDGFPRAVQRELGLPSLARNVCRSQSSIRIWTLFSRIGMSDKARETITPDVALGSMFHVLQDSFSPAHTCRVKANRHGSEFALLKDVYNYSEQPDKKKHASLDGFPNWLKQIAQGKGHRYANDPVEVGAWLIAAVDKKLEWSDVEAHLKDTAFASVSDAPTEQGLSCIHADLQGHSMGRGGASSCTTDFTKD